MAKKTRKTGPTYCVVQIDYAGRRVVGTGFATARDAANSISTSEWVDAVRESFAVTWNAVSPDGTERFEIGVVGLDD